MPKEKKQKGFTLVELMIVVAIAAIVTLSLGIVLADSLRGWNTLYGRIHSQEAENTYAVRLLFDKAVRKSSSDPGNIIFGTSPLSLTVYYYSDFAIKTTDPPDREAVFSYNGSDLKVEDKDKATGAILSTWTIPNVIGCVFQRSGRALQMVLTLNNNLNNRPQTFTVISSAYLHSQ